MNKKRRPLQKQINVRLDPDQAEQLRQKAWAENISISSLIRRELLSIGIISPTVKMSA
jgi:predicted HicB family RNase H-like nuclease